MKEVSFEVSQRLRERKKKAKRRLKEEKWIEGRQHQ